MCGLLLLAQSTFKERVEVLQHLFDINGAEELNREEVALLTSCLLHGFAGLTHKPHMTHSEIKTIAQNVIGVFGND